MGKTLNSRLKEIRELKQLKAQTLDLGEEGKTLWIILHHLIDIKTWIANKEYAIERRGAERG